MNHGPGTPEQDRVSVRIPADGVYVSTLRLATASLAARCDLTVDDIEDLRLAVDEACALLLPLAGGEGGAGYLDAEFELAARQLRFVASIPAADGADIDRDGFSWTVLDALATSVHVSDGAGRLSISVTKRREAAAR